MRMSSIRYAITRWPAGIVGCWLRNELWDVFNRQIEESEALHSFVSKTDVFGMSIKVSVTWPSPRTLKRMFYRESNFLLSVRPRNARGRCPKTPARRFARGWE